jgi:hypothetical protein
MKNVIIKFDVFLNRTCRLIPFSKTGCSFAQRESHPLFAAKNSWSTKKPGFFALRNIFEKVQGSGLKRFVKHFFNRNNKKQSISVGFGLLEVIVAVGVWAFLAGAGIMMITGSMRLNSQSTDEDQATLLAAEGLDATRTIKKIGWITPFLVTSCTTGCGVATVSGTWGYAGTVNSIGKFTRQIFVTNVNRDTSGNIVDSGGTVDPDTYKVESKVIWNRTPVVTGMISLVSYLTNYVKTITAGGGILVFGDGGTTTDAMKYRTFDGSTWSSALVMADVDSGTTNKALRAVKIYASVARNEKVTISRHFDGTNQYIYGQVFNGSSWGNVQLFSSWKANTFLNVQNFDGTYLNNGDFMVVYSDNTNIPKMRTWNGSVWSGQSSLTSLAGGAQKPTYIRAAARPGTNEVMVAIYDQSKTTTTQYWNGSTWSVVTTHSTNSFNNGYQGMDFAWSTHSGTYGAITYITGGGDKLAKIKIFQANGSGGGTWGTEVNANTQANPISDLVMTASPTADEFMVCSKDSKSPDNITSQKAGFTGTSVQWFDPVNNIVTTNTVSSTQVTYGLAYETISGNPALIVYSDNTAVPKYKKYTVTYNVLDSAPSNISSLGGVMQSSRVIASPLSNDILILMADANLDVYSVFWDGTNDLIYTAPTSKTLTSQGVNGSAVTDYWYDFAWNLK